MIKIRVLITAIIFHFSSQCSAAPTYSLTELDSLFFSEDLRVSIDGTPYLQDWKPFETGSFHPYGMNSSGQIIGTAGHYSKDFRAALFQADESTGSAVFVREIPFIAPPPTWSAGWDVNENGDFLGGNTDGTYTSLQIITSSGSLLIPGGTSYRRPSFNNHLEIVGADVVGDAFFQDSSGRYDLENLVVNLSGFSIRSPTDINDAGQIVGYGRNSLDQASAFILTPIPVPSSFLMLLSGVLCLWPMIKCKREDLALKYNECACYKLDAVNS